MKPVATIAALSLLFATITSCGHNSGHEANSRPMTQMPAGVVIDSSSIPYTTPDGLNHSTFSLSIITTPYAQHGLYDIKAVQGTYKATSQFTMPRGGEDLRPVIRKDENLCTFTVGFFFGNDTTFHDYYQVSGRGAGLEMKYLKAYSFK